MTFFHFLGILDGRSRGIHRVVVGSVCEEHVDRLYPRHFGKTPGNCQNLKKNILNFCISRGV